MLPKTVTSLQHPLVKEAASLRQSKAFREETQRVLLIGEKMVREIKAKRLVIFSLKPVPELSADLHILVTSEVLKKITGIGPASGMAAIVPLPKWESLNGVKRLLILDRIQDPGNLGTLLRSAFAFGWEGVVATPQTADFFNDKALRASQGAVFQLKLSVQTEEMIKEEAVREKRQIYIADLTGEPVPRKASLPLGLVLSHEGQGVQSWAQNLGRKITLRMRFGVDSLNVSVAGGILLYEMGDFR